MRKTLLVLVTLASPLSAQGRTLVDLHWLAGCWERARPTSRMVELWTPAVNNVMTGTSYSVTDTSQRELEQLRLFARGDTLIYEAHPSSQMMNEFKSTKITAQEIVFEDPEHDFPQKITYRRSGADSLYAVTEGDRAGRAQPITFAFKRAPCGKLTYSPTAATRVALQQLYDAMSQEEAKSTGGRLAWLTQQAGPGYRYTVWSATGSSVTSMDSAGVARIAEGQRRAQQLPGTRKYQATVDRVLLRGDTAEALVTGRLVFVFADSAGRIGPAGAMHERVVEARWLDTWVRQGQAMKLRSSATLAEDIRMDGKLTISNGRPVSQ
jgi:hypothetical protein